MEDVCCDKHRFGCQVTGVCTCDHDYDPGKTRRPYAGHNLPRASTTRTVASGETLFEGRFPRHKGAE